MSLLIKNLYFLLNFLTPLCVFATTPLSVSTTQSMGFGEILAGTQSSTEELQNGNQPAVIQYSGQVGSGISFIIHDNDNPSKYDQTTLINGSNKMIASLSLTRPTSIVNTTNTLVIHGTISSSETQSKAAGDYSGSFTVIIAYL